MDGHLKSSEWTGDTWTTVDAGVDRRVRGGGGGAGWERNVVEPEPLEAEKDAPRARAVTDVFFFSRKVSRSLIALQDMCKDVLARDGFDEPVVSERPLCGAPLVDR